MKIQFGFVQIRGKIHKESKVRPSLFFFGYFCFLSDFCQSSLLFPPEGYSAQHKLLRSVIFLWTYYECLYASFLPLKSDHRRGRARLTGRHGKKLDDSVENINMSNEET